MEQLFNEYGVSVLVDENAGLIVVIIVQHCECN